MSSIKKDNKQLELRKRIAYLLYLTIFRFTPEDYRSYSFFFPWIRRKLVESFLLECGSNARVKHNCDISPFIKIGDNSEFGQRCLIHSDVSIGSHVIMGPDVKIYSRNHIFESIDVPIATQGKEGSPTSIGDDVWLGANAVILPGVRVGSHSIIAAGAIVSKDIPEYAVVGGNPAEIIRFRNA